MEVGRVVLVRHRLAQGPDRQAGAVAGVDREGPAHADHRARLGDRRELVHAVPDDSLDYAGAVAESELQERVAVALLAPRPLAHHEDAVDGLAVRQVADEEPVVGESRLLHEAGQVRPAPGR